MKNKLFTVSMLVLLMLINLSFVQCAWLPKLPGKNNDSGKPEVVSNQLHIRIPVGSQAIYINNEELTLSSAPAYINDKGSAMIPLRFISDIIVAKVDWIPESKEIHIKKDDKLIQLQVNRPYALINGQIVELANPVEILEERAYVPFRFIAQQFGFVTDWIPESKTITLSKHFD
jgi:hypothetical protein